jgi:hypothetical protein
MVFYNWRRIYALTKGSSFKIFDVIEYLTYRKLPWNKLSKHYWVSQHDWHGDSFLINPRDLLEQGQLITTKRDIAEYVGLASMRNYAEYKVFGDPTLDFLACSGKEDIIQRNRLLRLEDGRVHFLYEDAVPNKKE